MRKLAATQVRAAFREEMRKRLPAFVAEPSVGSNFDLYVSDLASVRFYALLQLHQTRDAFTIEIGWSEQGRAPAKISFLMLPSDEPVNGEKCFRLRRLSRGEHQDRWWELVAVPDGWPFSEQNLVDVEDKLTGDELKRRTDLVAAEAVAELAEHAGRYFRRVAAEHNIAPPLDWPQRN
jgi:hypothetical protein